MIGSLKLSRAELTPSFQPACYHLGRKLSSVNFLIESHVYSACYPRSGGRSTDIAFRLDLVEASICPLRDYLTT